MSTAKEAVPTQNKPVGNKSTGPRTLADEIASIQPGGAPEAVRKEQRHRAEQLGGAVEPGKPVGKGR